MRGPLLFLLVTLFACPASADPRRHTVAHGDTLGALALRYRVSVDDLRDWNGLEDDTIQLGQRLSVEAENPLRYRIVPGDTLRCIARRYHVPVRQILDDNPRDARHLNAGQTLTLRGAVEPRRESPTSRVTVEEGDTLSAIADRLHTTVAAIEAANPDQELAPLPVGAELVVPGTEPVMVVIAPGDTLSHIARAHDVSVEQIRGWNPDLDPTRLRVGTELSLGRSTVSQSVGAAYCGHIEGAVQLTGHDAYVLRNPERSYATARTIRRLRGGFDALHRAYPAAPRVRVHDLSLPNGGPIDDHRSHQSGRDVDVTYYRREGCSSSDGCPLEDVEPAELDVRRQWRLFRHWLQRDEVEAIYMDYALQRPLYREARRRGASAAQLREWFQFPRGPRDGEGAIRHFPNHRDHFHVRFACAENEARCQ